MGKPLLLIKAAESNRRDGEDRLTEILASALDAHPGFCNALNAELGLPPAVRYCVETQHWADPQCRVDMRIAAFGASDQGVSVVYSEHKLDGYGFAKGQAQREREGLTREPGDEKRLICIVSTDDLGELQTTTAGPSANALPSFDKAMTWNDISRLAQDAGESWSEPWGGSGWTRQALMPEAPACQRVLAEFLAYLEGGEVLGPLSAEDIRTFHLADQAQGKVHELMTLASAEAKPYAAIHGKKDKFPYPDKSETGVTLSCINFEIPADHWLDHLEDAALTLAIATADAGSPTSAGEPTIYAGLYLATKSDSESAQADAEWMTAASEASFRPLPYQWGLWLCRSVQLGWVLDQGATLEKQAARLSGWLVETFNAATSLPPRPPSAPQ